MASGIPDHPLGQPSCAAGVNHIYTISPLHRDTLLDPLTPQLRTPHEAIPVHLAPRPIKRVPSQLLALPDDRPGRLPRRKPLGLDNIIPVRDRRLIPIDPTRRSENSLGPRGIDTLRQRVGREAPKDNSMDGAQPRHGQQPDQRGGDHGHIHEYSIAFANALGAQHRRQGLDVVQQLGVADALFCARHGAVVQDRGLAAVSRLHVAVDAVVARRDLAVREPLPVVVGLVRLGEGLGVPAQHGGGLLVPVEVGGLLGPEGLWVLEG